ncbi:MAG: ion channel [Clostridium sp.]|uniref:ion channel n=1 Tax=Clostridium sp. TaxID=1506 RepID=UPI002FC67686
MTTFKSLVFKPWSALVLYIMYILSLSFLNTVIDTALGYAIMIWLGLVFYIYLIVYSCRSIMYASKNQISSVNALISIGFCALAGVVFFAVNFFYIYQISSRHFIGHIGNNSFDMFISFLYFSFATFATVGYGDIAAISSLSKILTILEIIYSFFIITVAFSSFSHLKDSLKKK